MSDEEKHGMRTGLTAVFRHNKIIKIPLLPAML